MYLTPLVLATRLNISRYSSKFDGEPAERRRRPLEAEPHERVALLDAVHQEGDGREEIEHL